MRPNQFLKVQVLNQVTETWEDITNGILSIDSVTGSDSFEGFWDQPDTGQFVITTRGNTSDPNLNPLITTSSLIKVFVDVANTPLGPYDQDIFYGFITDVNVEYRKNDTQLVTINGTDFMGYLNRLVVTQEFIDTEITPTYPDQVVPGDYLITKAAFGLAPELQDIIYIEYTSANNFGIFFASPDPVWQVILPTPAKVKVEVGKTLYELVALSMSSGLMRYESEEGIQFFFMPYYKNDPVFYSQKELEFLTFDVNYVRTDESEPWQYPYEPNYISSESTFRTIKLSNGLSKIINQVSISNIDPETEESLTIDPLSSEADVSKYGPALLNAQTSFTTSSSPFWLDSLTIESQGEQFQKNVIFDQSEPETTIESITIDMAKYFSSGQNIPDNGNQMWVQHKLPNGEYIQGYFKIAGIRHTIDESNWTAEFILRPSEFVTMINNRPKEPTFTLTADEEPDEYGYYDTETNFTVSINNYTAEDLANIDKIEWALNFPYLEGIMGVYTPGTPPSQQNQKFGYTVPAITGISTTWNYDDGGTFGPPYPDYWESASGLLSPPYGPGRYHPYVYITDKNGFTTNYLVADLSIVGATAHADFTITKSSSEIVTFIDTSSPDTNTWEWDFGDGTTYTGKTPPPKQYAASGTYNVRLDVDNGFTTDHVIKPVTINVYQIPVQYIKLRYQGTVTRPAGATEYPVDLIDTIGLLEIKNTSFTQMGGIQPFYFGRIGTMEKVQEVGKGNFYQWLRILDDPITKANHFEYIHPAPPLNPSDPNYPYVPYTPLYTTNYASGGPLDPMSQTWMPNAPSSPTRGTDGGTFVKYRFIPVITDNEDGSQTKSIDIDINFWYSQTYVGGSAGTGPSSVYRKWYNNRPALESTSGIFGGPSQSYLPGGRLASLAYWPFWAPATGDPSYSQALKIKEINIWPGMDTKINKTTSRQNVNIGTNSFMMWSPPVDPPLDRYGVIPGKTYLPIEIAVSENGTTFHKIGEAEYVSGNTLTTTYDVPMPPFSDAPILT
jgi:PKD repeat protein